ncbi:uncharacterised conserved protein UCP033563 [Candidatus Vecturithrix granuli]|uniref:Uncharacterized conserved protein UCP033563 n=1 Tax=Vecturithrix granuli TaxID=1499967 RepID=A0A0S6W925_VECG1|nr:uncharacterised conserved protein UCP033563 [Candidatus Vecturithrix granuli]
MAVIRPLQAYRPTPELAAKIAALPYDVMNSDEAREMAKDNPYSFLHVDKAEIDLEPSIDLYDQRVYEKARDNLNTMISKGWLVQDAQEHLYIYKEVMQGRSQVGLVTRTSIDDYLKGIIKIHEFTRADKEQDRINHVDYTNANTGLIFLTYRPHKEIDAIMNAWIAAHQPVYDFTSDDGIRHTVWIIEDQKVIQALVALFARVEAFYVADGHHRTASAAKVGQMRRAKHPDYTGNEAFNYFLSVLFPSEQLYIMDYNRVVKDLHGLSEAEFLNKVKEKFDIEKYQGEGQYKPAARHTFGMYLEGKWYKLTPKPGSYNEDDPIARLDVSILQNNLLSPILGIHDPKTDKRIDFVGGIRGLQELEKRVKAGMKVAFSMHPTSINDVMAVADAGKTMPPKSTWFEPKLRSGLFIHKLS